MLYGVRTSYFGTRHGLSLALPALMWSGCGFWELESRLTEYLRKKDFHLPSLFSVRILLLIASLSLLLPQTVLSYRSDKIELKKAGLCLRAEGFQGQRFTGENRLYRIGFYGGLTFVPLPTGLDFTSAIKFARATDAGFLLIDERTTDFSVEDRRRAEGAGGVQRIGCPALGNLRDYSLVIYRLSQG